MFGAGASSRRHARRRFESSAWMAALVAILAVTMLVVAPVSADPIGPGDIGGGGGIDLGPQPVPKWSMPDRFHLSPSVWVPVDTPPDPLGQEWQDYIRPPQGWVLNVDGCASYDFGGGSMLVLLGIVAALYTWAALAKFAVAGLAWPWRANVSMLAYERSFYAPWPLEGLRTWVGMTPSVGVAVTLMPATSDP